MFRLEKKISLILIIHKSRYSKNKIVQYLSLTQSIEIYYFTELCNSLRYQQRWISHTFLQIKIKDQVGTQEFNKRHGPIYSRSANIL